MGLSQFIETLQKAEQYASLFGVIAQAHKDAHDGHDLCHAARVANIAGCVAREEFGSEHLASLSVMAGLCHNADHLLRKELDRKPSPDEIGERIHLWLMRTTLSSENKDMIVTAVVQHNGKNDPHHHPVTICLRDADRIVNLDLDVVIRSGQFYHALPAVDYVNFLSDPEANYKNPKSCLYDISLCLEWVDPTNPFCMQTKTGMQLGLLRAKKLQQYFDDLKGQLQEYGYCQNA